MMVLDFYLVCGGLGFGFVDFHKCYILDSKHSLINIGNINYCKFKLRQ